MPGGKSTFASGQSSVVRGLAGFILLLITDEGLYHIKLTMIWSNFIILVN